MSVLVAFDLKVSFFFFFFHLFEPISFPPLFSFLYFSYSVTSKPSFFKPLPSSSVYFPYFGWKVYGSKAVTLATSAAALPALRSYLFGRCVYGHDTNCFMSRWLSFSPRHGMDSLSSGSMQLPSCNLHCLVPSNSSELDSSSEWSYPSWTCCAFIFYFYSHLCAFSGSLSGKEPSPAVALAVPCSIVCYHRRIQNIKAHCFFCPRGAGLGGCVP